MNGIELKQRVRATEKGLKRLDDRLNLSIQQDDGRLTRLEDLLAEFILENKEGFAKLHHEVQILADSQEYWDRRMDDGMTELRRELAESQQRLTDSQNRWGQRMNEGMAELRRELAESQRKLIDSQNRWDQRMNEGMAELRRELAESQKRTDDKIAAGFAEFQKRLDARDAEFQKRQDARDAEFQKRTVQLDKKIADSRTEIGNLSHRLGTFVEDLVVPNLPGIFKELVKCPEEREVLVNVRTRRRHPMQSGKMLEIDAIVDCGSYVLVNETKSQLTPEKVKQFLEKLAVIREYFPEYQGYTLLGCVSSLFVEPSLVEYASRQGLLVLAMTAGLMTLQNPPGFIWRGF